VRCIPHVHGSSREVFSIAKKIINNELNSISDNPLVFPNGDVMNSGHFHAEPVAQALDTLSIAMSEIGSIAERRVNYLMKGIGDRIPMFGAVNPGLESGFMLAHVTAAALASENKTLAHPASVDSISTSAGQEDFVSMAPWAGRKCLRILDNVRTILAIEIIVAGNVNYRFHKKLVSGNGLIPVMNLLRRHQVLSMEDRPLSNDFATVNQLIQSGKLINSVNKRIKLS
jgi:histidine ammonia-lyase